MSDAATQTDTSSQNLIGKYEALMEPLDTQIKTGKNTALDLGVLLRSREALYRKSGSDSRAFIAHTSTKTGLSRAVLQRLRRIGHIPEEVRQVLTGTKIANRQDLLVELADKIERDGITLEEALQAAWDLVVNPPKYGPRTTPKVQQPTSAIEVAAPEPAVELGVVVIEGLPIAMAFPDGQPRIQDLELGRRLGFSRQRDVRKLIKDLIAGGHLSASELRDRPSQTPRSAGRPSDERWLDEEQALFVATQAGTPIARTISRQVVRAFVAARRELNKPVLDKELVGRLEAALGPLYSKMEQTEKRLGALERNGLGSYTMVMVPKVEREDAGYSMEALNKALIEKGYNISENDTAIRTIAARLGLIGDDTYGFWNKHNDSVNRKLSESWRFNDAGAGALQPFVVQYCELKSTHEAAKESAPREKALQEVINNIHPIGVGKHAFLTRTLDVLVRNPFPGLRGVGDAS